MVRLRQRVTIMISLRSVFVDEPDPHWHKPRSPIPGHILFLVNHGSFTYRIGEAAYRLSKGDILYMPDGTVREGIQQPGELHQKYTILFDVPSPPELPILAWNQVVHLRSLNADYMKNRFTLLVQQWLGKLPYYRLMCEGIAQELLIMVNRESDAAMHSHPKLKTVQTMQQYILQHYREPVHIGQLAGLVERTPNYATALFKEIMGVPPMTYLQLVRVSAAKELLLNTSMSVGQIAEHLCFYDAAHFHRVYRKHTGQPPSAR